MKEDLNLCPSPQYPKQIYLTRNQRMKKLNKLRRSHHEVINLQNRFKSTGRHNIITPVYNLQVDIIIINTCRIINFYL
jgi:hypothetical protein